VLIGEPGVGKTAVVEGLAQRIVEGDVAESLKDKQLVSLDISALVAGAMYRGQFEERLKSVLKEITESDGRIITFIDELHVLMGAGGRRGLGRGIQHAQAHARRGELRLIGATRSTSTASSSRRMPRSSAASSRCTSASPRWRTPSRSCAGSRSAYEAHHRWPIADAASSPRHPSPSLHPEPAAARQGHRPRSTRPRRGCDGDRLGAVEIDELRRHVDRLKLEELALKSEKDDASKERLAKLRETLVEKERELAGLEARWARERQGLNRVGELKKQLDEAITERDRAMREADYQRASKLEYETIRRLERDLAEAEQVEDATDEPRMVNEQVTEEDIAAVISAWTGIRSAGSCRARPRSS
jgi:ATP-dependent Clp protease ATP-binding subunit ClpB